MVTVCDKLSVTLNPARGDASNTGVDVLQQEMVCVLLADQDGDKKLTLSEFISLPVGTVENQQAQDIDDDWVRERKKEFQEVIDSDHDGIVTMEELEVPVLPFISFY